MSDQRYGFIREVECDLIDEVLERLKAQFGAIRFLEIGVFGGGTVKGVYRRAAEIGCPVHCAGVDFENYRPNPAPPLDYKFYTGDSMDTWRKINEGFNFLFVDGCHCVNHSMADFLNYSPMLEVGGYCLFHDTSGVGFDQVQGEWPQDHSYAGQPPSVLGVRSGLRKMGILQGYRSDWELVREVPSDGLMGMILFKKIKPL